jgi:Flp pilus assembly protein TadG
VIPRVRRFARDEGGQAIVMMTITLLGIVMIVALAVDAGLLYSSRRTMQEAADAGAYAAAVVLYEGGSAAQAVQAAKDDATRNGFTDDTGTGGTTSVLVALPPTSGTFAQNPNYAHVTISAQVRTVLMPESSLTAVTVRGLAGAESLNNQFALMALDRGSTSNALRVGPSVNVTVSGAGVAVNSTAANAAVQDGISPITVTAPHQIKVTGGTSGTWPPTTLTGQPQVADPFAGYPKPSTSGLPVYTSLPPGPAMVLNPGVYDVPIEADAATSITLNSGVYILRRGISPDPATFANVTSAAGGVLLFNTNQQYPNSGGGCQKIELDDNLTMNVAAMTAGAYAGLVIYQDPICQEPIEIEGTGTVTLTGTVYAPNAGFELDSDGATLNGSQIVAKTIYLKRGTMSINFSTANTAQPKLPRLTQ